MLGESGTLHGVKQRGEGQKERSETRPNCDGWCEFVVREGPLCELVRQGLPETQVEDGAHRVREGILCRVLRLEWAGVQELQAA